MLLANWLQEEGHSHSRAHLIGKKSVVQDVKIFHSSKLIFPEDKDCIYLNA